MRTASDNLARPRPWLNDTHRASLARSFGCDPSEVERRLDAYAKSEAYIAERMEREGHPFPRVWSR
jgi:hypothetical protein